MTSATPAANAGMASDPVMGGRKRADARQNAEKVLRAAMSCLGARPDASINDIAAAAGVGRVTLYSHYKSRESLIEAALAQAVHDGDATLADIDLTDPVAGLRALIDASWHLTAQASGLLEAAQGVIPDERIREIHSGAEARVLDLIQRGQQSGVFRSDLPASWLASVLHHLMKGAAADLAAGRLTRADAPVFIHRAVLGAYAGS